MKGTMESNSLKWTFRFIMIGSLIIILILTTPTGIIYQFSFATALIVAGMLFLIDFNVSTRFYSLLLSIIIVWCIAFMSSILSHFELVDYLKTIQKHIEVITSFTLPTSLFLFCFMMKEYSDVRLLSESVKKWKLAIKLTLLVYGIPTLYIFSLYVSYLIGKTTEFSLYYNAANKSNMSLAEDLLALLFVIVILLPFFFVLYSLSKTISEAKHVAA